MIVGIDLGTSTSEVAVLKNGKPVLIREIGGASHGILPSVVGVGSAGTLIVGENAEKLLVPKPEFAVEEVKRLMGRGDRIRLGGEDFTAQEISAMVLRHLKTEVERYLGEPVSEAVVTVPAYFDALQRQATVDAGELAGFEVRRIVNEPTAAALAYGVQRPGVEEKIVVYDLGGGTLDVTVLDLSEGILDVLASTGNNQLGGKDFDERLMQFLQAECLRRTSIDLFATARTRARLKAASKRAKEELSSVSATEVVLDNIGATAGGEAVDFEFTLTREMLNAQIRNLVESSQAQLDEALGHKGLSSTDIQTVLLVGGSTRIPLVRDFVSRYFGGRTLATQVQPDEAVALGAAVMAGIVAGDNRTGTLITDVSAFTLGVQVRDVSGPVPKYDSFSVLIPKQTVIPRTAKRLYQTSRDEQDAVLVRVFQGDSDRCSQNQFVGEVELALVDRGPAGEEIEVEFSYDLNNLLRVKVTEVATGRSAEGIVRPQRERMSDSEKTAARRRLEGRLGSGGTLSRGAPERNAAAPTPPRASASAEAASWRNGPLWIKVAALVSHAEKCRAGLNSDARARVAHLVDRIEAAVRAGNAVELEQAEGALTDLLFELE